MKQALSGYRVEVDPRFGPDCFIHQEAFLAAFTILRLGNIMEPVLSYDFKTGIIEVIVCDDLVIYRMVPESERGGLEKALNYATGVGYIVGVPVSAYGVLHNYLHRTNELPNELTNS